MATVNYIRERSGWSGEVRDDARSYSRSWYVFRKVDGVMTAIDFDDAYDLIVPSYASIGATVAEIDGVECVSIEPQHQDDGSEVWVVTARYESPSAGEEEQPDNFNEFMSRSQNDSQNEAFGPRRSGGGQVIEEYFEEDLDGQPILNSAGDPFDEPLSQPVTIQVDSVTVNERTAPDTSRIGMADGYRLLANITYSESEHVNRTTGVRTRYFVNTYEVWTHPYREWKWAKVLDRGYREKVRENGVTTLVVIRDEFGEPVNTPALLDISGAQVPPGGQPHTLLFRVRNEGPLNVPFLG